MLTRTIALSLLAISCTRDVQPATASVSGTSPTSGCRPDILLVSIDSLRPDHLGCYGYKKPTSPNIDRLASEGVRFRPAVTTTSWTLPAHIAMLTGIYDSAHGVTDTDRSLSPKIRTLAQMLHDAGYQTGGFFGGPFLHPVFGFARGFDSYVNCMSWTQGESKDEQVRRILDPHESASHEDITGPCTLEAVTKYLDGVRGDDPLFCFVHLWDVHYDYIPPESYWRRFDPDYTGSLDARDFMHNPAIHPQMPERELQHLLALYDGEIAFTDEILGRIVDAWKARRDLDNTVVVITADHGEEFFEHRNKGHQTSLFGEVLRVPLIVRWPARVQGGRKLEDLVRLVDLTPTLASIGGVSESLRVEGRDISPLFFGGTLPPREALAELLVDDNDLRALRTKTLKVLRYDGGKQYFALDMVNDPKERRPLPADSPELAWGRGQLDAALARTREFSRELDAPARTIQLDSALRDSLRGLGYIGDENGGIQDH